MRSQNALARIGMYLNHQLVASGAYGKDAKAADLYDFAPWLEVPIDLSTAMKDWK